MTITATATATATITAHTATRSDRLLSLRVERRGNTSVVTHCRGHVPLAPRLLRGDPATARVALVQTTASVLSGDRIAIDIELGAGASLKLTTIGATVAYPAMAQATHSVRCRLGEGARFAWLPEPLVLARDCDLSAQLELELETGAAALVRELVVLGRHAERPGRYASILRCNLAGAPLLRDSVAIDPDTTRSRVRLDGATVFCSLALLGIRRTGGPLAGELALAGPGQVCRLLGGDAAAVNRELGPIETAYAAALWARGERTAPGGAEREACSTVGRALPATNCGQEHPPGRFAVRD